MESKLKDRMTQPLKRKLNLSRQVKSQDQNRTTRLASTDPPGTHVPNDQWQQWLIMSHNEHIMITTRTMNAVFYTTYPIQQINTEYVLCNTYKTEL